MAQREAGHRECQFARARAQQQECEQKGYVVGARRDVRDAELDVVEEPRSFVYVGSSRGLSHRIDDHGAIMFAQQAFEAGASPDAHARDANV